MKEGRFTTQRSPTKRRILKRFKKTWGSPYVLVKNFLVNKKFDYSEYYHSDGIGTKGIYH